MTKTQSVDAVIILGAMVRPDGSPSPAMVRRVRCGVDRLQAGETRFLILSGGSVGYLTPEAQIMQRLALDMGARPDQLILEEKSINTIENIRFSAPLAREHGVKSLAVMTDSYHLPRALYICRRLGVRAVGWGVAPRHDRIHWEWWLAYLREVVAMPRTIWRIECRLWREKT